MKKLLYIPLGSVEQAKPDYLFEAFKEKFDVRLFSGVEHAIEFQPNVVHVHSGAFPVSGLLTMKNEIPGSIWTQWTGDANYAPLQPVIIGKDVFDYTFLAVGDGQNNMYKSLAGMNVGFLPEAIPNERIFEPKNLQNGPIVFVGNLYDSLPGGDERKEMAQFLGSRLKNFVVYGNFHVDGVTCYGPIPWERLPDIYNSAFVTIAHDNYWDIKNYFTQRHLEAMANSCCLSRRFEGFDSKFADYNHVVSYKNKYELFDMIQFLLKNPSVRNDIAKAGHHYIKSLFTYRQWVDKYYYSIFLH